jgi:hypothetical protein
MSKTLPPLMADPRFEYLKRYDGLQSEEGKLPSNVILHNGTPGLLTTRTLELLKMVDAPENMKRARIKITTDQIDRTNDQMEMAGAKLDNFTSNPVVLWEHNRFGGVVTPPAIATCPALFPSENDFEAEVLFHGVTELSRDIGTLVEIGVIRTSSIGFIPLAWRDSPVTQEMVSAGLVYPGIGTIRTFTAWELLEFSLCNIPMNPGAQLVDHNFEKGLREAIVRGMISADGELVKSLTATNTITLSTSNMTVEEKAGRSISAKNLAELKSAHAESTSATKRLSALIKAAEDGVITDQEAADAEEAGKGADKGSQKPDTDTKKALADLTDLVKNLAESVASLKSGPSASSSSASCSTSSTTQDAETPASTDQTPNADKSIEADEDFIAARLKSLA